MLRAICTDLVRIPGCRVITTLAAPYQHLRIDGVETVVVDSPEEEVDAFRRLAAESDACLVIAPELDNVLLTRCRAARRAGARRVLNPIEETVALCSDKLLTWEFLSRRRIPAVPTDAWPPAASEATGWSPVVVKPRFGAGSQDIHIVPSLETARDHLSLIAADQWIVQPLVRGTAVSVGAICSSEEGVSDLLPVADQRLSADGRLRYLGGRVPGRTERSGEVHELVRRACSELPGLCGYVGFDVIVPESRSEPAAIVEINPRLCTSYLGYRQAAIGNPAARLLGPARSGQPLAWRTTAVTFYPDGRWEHNAVCPSDDVSAVSADHEEK